MSTLLRRLFQEDTILSGIVLLMAGISPIIFPAAQGGLAPMSWLATWLLIPSVGIIFAVFGIATIRGHSPLRNRMLAGGMAGVLATVGLESVRLSGFYFGWMPGDLAMLLGVLLTDRFMLGPSVVSTILGYTYHYWNGAAFGMVFAILVGRKPVFWGILYGLLIGLVFLVSPAVQATGAGFLGIEMPMMPVTIGLAHFVFGSILGFLCHRWIRDDGWLLGDIGGDVPLQRPH